MVAPHLRQRILARRSVTFSSAIEYLAWHAGQEIFTISLADALSWSSGRWETVRKLCAIGSRSASLINGYAPVQFSVSAAAERATLLSFLVKIARPHAGVPGMFDPAMDGRLGSEYSKKSADRRVFPLARRARASTPKAATRSDGARDHRQKSPPEAFGGRSKGPRAQEPMANSAKSRASSRSASSAFSPSSRSASSNSRLAPLRSPWEISSSARPA
jgi:hypothetical protein